MAAQTQFNVSDKVVYPPHGVGVINAIENRKISGTEVTFYVIDMMETGMTARVAINQVASVGLRKIVNDSVIKKVYALLKDRNITIDTQTWNRRHREYLQKIKTGSVIEIAEVIRDLVVLKADKELSFGEKRMLDQAQGLLVKEIAIAKTTSEENVKKQLEDICQVSL